MGGPKPLELVDNWCEHLWMEAGTMNAMAATWTDEDWKRLGDAIAQQRVDMGMTQDELADAADVSTTTIGNREAGKPGRLLEMTKIAKALGWTSNSCRLILEGKPPIMDETTATANNHDALLLRRPSEIDDQTWAEIKDEISADFEKYLRWRRPR